MDKGNLNQKSWYRAIKVIFILAFLFSQTIGFVITSELANKKSSFVRCDNGRELEDSYLFYTDDTEKLKIYKKCDFTAFLLNNSKINGILTDTQRIELEDQISQMKNNSTLQSEIQSFVDNYKEKYADRTPSQNIGKKLTREEFEKLYNHDPYDTFFVTGKDARWVSNFTIDYKETHPLAVKIEYYALLFLIVSVVFWFISRIFFYIFAKEPFFRIR